MLSADNREAGVVMTAARDDGWQVPAFEVAWWLERSSPWCVIIPVINEGRYLPALLERLCAARVHELADILIADGGSTDGSLDPDRLKAAGVRGVLVKTGEGRLSAQLRCGYAFALRAGFEGIVTIDGNNKDNPATIPVFIDAMRQGVDFVQASRFLPGGIGENTPRSREFAIRLIHAPLLRLSSGFPWTDTTQGFRAYRSRLLLDPRIAPFRDVFRDYELLAYLSHRAPRLGYRCLEIATERRYPRGEVPTKIKGLRGNLRLLGTLLRACGGLYNPPVSGAADVVHS